MTINAEYVPGIPGISDSVSVSMDVAQSKRIVDALKLITTRFNMGVHADPKSIEETEALWVLFNLRSALEHV